MLQGRQTEWLPEQLGISRNYLYRMRLNPSNPMYRPPQAGLWAKCERLLGVPAGSIEPRHRTLGTRDRLVTEDRLRGRRRQEPVAATA
jgi:hypothetical protein